MNDWDDYRLLLALERTGTLRAAAEILEVNHSTVSRRLKQLNKHYGEAVFERSTLGYRPSMLGKELITAARQIEAITLANLRQQRAKRKGMSGPIKLSLPPPFGQYLLLDELIQFREQYPEIELTIESSFSLSNLDRAEADVVIRASDEPPNHWIGHRVGELKLNFYAQLDYYENTAKENYQWIGRTRDEVTQAWIEESPYPNAPIGISSEDIMMRHYFAKAGYGLTLGACYMAEQEADLIRIGNKESRHYSDVWVLTHPDLRETPRIKALMQFLTATLKAKKNLLEGIK